MCSDSSRVSTSSLLQEDMTQTVSPTRLPAPPSVADDDNEYNKEVAYDTVTPCEKYGRIGL